MEYIRFDEDRPIMEQVPEYRSAAFLLHPFIQMPCGWSERSKTHPYQHLYPNDEEIVRLGRSIHWEEVRRLSGLSSLKEVAMALVSTASKTSHQRPDLEEKLSNSIPQDFYWPQEDRISVMLSQGILNEFYSYGSHNFHFSEPVFDTAGQVNIKNCNLLTIGELSPAEIIIMDDQLESVFISQYDSYFTLFLSKQHDIGKILALHNWEAIVCDEETKIDWFLE